MNDSFHSMLPLTQMREDFKYHMRKDDEELEKETGKTFFKKGNAFLICLQSRIKF